MVMLTKFASFSTCCNKLLYTLFSYCLLMHGKRTLTKCYSMMRNMHAPKLINCRFKFSLSYVIILISLSFDTNWQEQNSQRKMADDVEDSAKSFWSYIIYQSKLFSNEIYVNITLYIYPDRNQNKLGVTKLRRFWDFRLTNKR